MLKYTVVPLDDFQPKLGAAGTGPTIRALSVSPAPHLTTSTFIHIELSSVALGGKVVAVSDDFFADVSNLLKVEVTFHTLATDPTLAYLSISIQPAQSLKGQFGPNGALFDGWESRRHNPTYDWCIVKLGTPGHIIGFDIDTANFSGNEASQASVQGMFSDGEPSNNDEKVRARNALQRVSR